MILSRNLVIVDLYTFKIIIFSSYFWTALKIITNVVPRVFSPYY